MVLSIILIFILSLLAEWFFPWWSIAVVAFLIGFWKTPSGWKAMAAGFFGVALLWFVAAGWSHFTSGGILTKRVGEMFGISTPMVIVFATALLGGLVGGLTANSGYLLRSLLKSSPS